MESAGSDDVQRSIEFILRLQDLPDRCLVRVLAKLNLKEDKDAASLTCSEWSKLVDCGRRPAAAVHILHPMSSKDITIFQMQGDAHYEIRRQERLWRDVGIEALEALSAFPEAKAITIEGFSWADADVLIPAAFQCLFSLPQPRSLACLTTLHLRYVSFQDLQWMKALTLACPALAHIRLQTLQRGYRCDPLMDSHLESLALGCQQLASLRLSVRLTPYHMLSYSSRTISDAGIDSILTNCSAMTELFLHGHMRITGWGLRRGTGLTALSLKSCRFDSWNAEGLEEGLREGPGANLRHLSLRWVILSTSASIPLAEIVARTCPNLQKLRIDEVHGIDLGEEQVNVFNSVTFPSLRSLFLRPLEISRRAEMAWLEALPLLEELYFDHPKKVNIITSPGMLPSLKVLIVPTGSQSYRRKIEFKLIEAMRVARPTVHVKLYHEGGYLLTGAEYSSDSDDDEYILEDPTQKPFSLKKDLAVIVGKCVCCRCRRLPICKKDVHPYKNFTSLDNAIKPICKRLLLHQREDRPGLYCKERVAHTIS